MQGQPAEAAQRLAGLLGVAGALGEFERLRVQGLRQRVLAAEVRRRAEIAEACWRPGRRRRARARSPGSPAGRPRWASWSACTDGELARSVQRDGAQPLVRSRARGGQRRVERGAAERDRAAHQPERGQRPGQRRVRGTGSSPASGPGGREAATPGRPGSCPARLPAGPARRPGPARPGPPARRSPAARPGGGGAATAASPAAASRSERVLVDRFEHAVAHAAGPLLGGQQRPVDQRGDGLEHHVQRQRRRPGRPPRPRRWCTRRRRPPSGGSTPARSR